MSPVAGYVTFPHFSYMHWCQGVLFSATKFVSIILNKVVNTSLVSMT